MQERVQLNLSITLEQKLALQALAEGYGTSVTKLVLGLIEVPEVAAVVVEAGVGVLPDSPAPGVAAQVPPSSSLLVSSPADVSGVVGRVASGRVFAPDPKVAKREKRVKPEPWPALTCRHGLLRCKVCGTG